MHVLLALLARCCRVFYVTLLAQIFYVTLLAHRAVEASEKPRIMLRRLRFGITVLLSSVAPVNGEVSLVRSHSEMAARS